MQYNAKLNSPCVAIDTYEMNIAKVYQLTNDHFISTTQLKCNVFYFPNTAGFSLR